MDELRAKLGLPPVSQIGVVVRDVQKASAYYSDLFGIGPFTVYDWVPDRHWVMEKPSPLKLRMGKAPWGDLELELIQPLEGKSDHRDFIESFGEGIHHLGFNVPNYDEAFTGFLREGFTPMMRAESHVPAYNGQVRACYFDTRQIGGILFEIIWRSWLAHG
jgi:catechol 2,3-dioxygenase-like lactoylglutathione lyase family enzyme